MTPTMAPASASTSGSLSVTLLAGATTMTKAIATAIVTDIQVKDIGIQA